MDGTIFVVNRYFHVAEKEIRKRVASFSFSCFLFSIFCFFYFCFFYFCFLLSAFCLSFFLGELNGDEFESNVQTSEFGIICTLSIHGIEELDKGEAFDRVI